MAFARVLWVQFRGRETSAVEWMQVRTEVQVLAALALVVKEEIDLQGKEKEREKFVWRRETGMFMGMSVDWDRVKWPEKGPRPCSLLGELGGGRDTR